MFTRTIPSPKLVKKPSTNDDLVGGEVNDADLPRLDVTAFYCRGG
jgi:hypothetical protein